MTLALQPDASMAGAAARALPFGEVAYYSVASPDHPERNEDAALVVATETWGVLAVSDGAGGAAHAARASAATVGILQQALEQVGEAAAVRAALLDALESANALLREELPGALATLGAFVVDAESARAISVGDSVCAVIGGRGKLKYRSVAHGPTGFAEEAGLLSERQALTHDERHFVSNMLGLPGMRVEVGVPLKLAPRDTVLVACDALWDNATAGEIAERARLRPLPRAVDALAELARRRMLGDGPVSHADDLTILAFRRG